MGNFMFPWIVDDDGNIIEEISGDNELGLGQPEANAEE